MILTWHGVWCLTDSWFDMLGLDPLRSATLSLIIGTAGTAVIFVLQFPLVWWKIRISKKEDMDKNNVFILTTMCFSFFGTYCCINRYININNKLQGDSYYLFLYYLVVGFLLSTVLGTRFGMRMCV